MRFLLTCFLALVAFVALSAPARAQVESATVRASKEEAWIGERVPVFVELRAPGPFVGTATFDLPRIPGSLLLKVGNPVVSSETLEGEEWFVQAHEFALFSQRAGELEVPAFSVHFAHREGFTGPENEVRTEAPGWSVEIRKPPGSDAVDFLVTTESLEVTERWDPELGPVEAGAVFKREIAQRAEQLSGMALAPAPTGAPEGVRVYAGDAITRDTLERGAFRGEREETITYLLTRAGTVELPALEYVWWNPKTESLESTTLPSVTIEVAPAPAAAAEVAEDRGGGGWWIVAAGLLSGLGVWRRRHLVALARRVFAALNPPARVTARRLRRACRRNDPAAAEAAWNAWLGTRPAAFEPGPELRAAVRGLHRRRFAPGSAEVWEGEGLARALDALLSAERAQSSLARASCLPDLNPR